MTTATGAPREVDVLISGGHLLTMAGDGAGGEGAGFVADGAVAVQGRRIAAVGPRAEVTARVSARETIDARGALVMPGLIDAHIHSSAVLGRGWAQEVDKWMDAAYGPLMKHVDPVDAPLATLVALMEGVASGTTTFADYTRDMDRLVESHALLGSRGVVCDSISERNFARREEWVKAGWKPGDPTPLDPEAGRAALSRSLALHDRWDGHDEGRIRVIFGPHAADFMSTELLLQVQAEARRRGAKLHLHVAQDPRENTATLQRYGARAIPYLDRIGLLAPDLIAVHLSTATEAEVETVVRRGAGMVCCANSIGIIDGVMPPAALFKRLGGRVALGSDQAPGNNSHNVFSEMRAVAMFAKLEAKSPLAMPAWQVLRSATIEGARVLGIDAEVGSLEAGKQADLILLDATRPPLAPLLLRPARNVVPNLVYAETGRSVRLSMVAGRVIYRDGRYASVDADEVHRRLGEAAERLQARAAADPGCAELPIVELTRTGRI